MLEVIGKMLGVTNDTQAPQAEVLEAYSPWG